MPDGSAQTPPAVAQLHAPLARLLRPLVRLFIRSGLTFPALTALLRELYVNVAEHDFALSAKEQTDSRVSLLTGIHRKEVSRLRGAGAPVSTVPSALSHTSRIIALWLAEPEFTDTNGEPLALPRTGKVSFEMLVTSATRDVRPRVILDEWLDTGLVTIDGDGRVRLAQAGFVPAGGSEQQLYYFGRNLHDHAAAAVANILDPTPRFMERAVHYDGLTADAAARLEQRSREAAMEVLKRLNREANTLSKAEPAGGCRWTFGVYVYREEGGTARASAQGERER